MITAFLVTLNLTAFSRVTVLTIAEVSPVQCTLGTNLQSRTKPNKNSVSQSGILKKKKKRRRKKRKCPKVDINNDKIID